MVKEILSKTGNYCAIIEDLVGYGWSEEIESIIFNTIDPDHVEKKLSIRALTVRQ